MIPAGPAFLAASRASIARRILPTLGFRWLASQEGLLPALESSHAAAWLHEHLSSFAQGSVVLLNLSGRGDKDLAEVLAQA